jgi:hypothetical protein
MNKAFLILILMIPFTGSMITHDTMCRDWTDQLDAALWVLSHGAGSNDYLKQYYIQQDD